MREVFFTTLWLNPGYFLLGALVVYVVATFANHLLHGLRVMCCLLFLLFQFLFFSWIHVKLAFFKDQVEFRVIESEGLVLAMLLANGVSLFPGDYFAHGV